ncbi:hypothetical protein HWV62_14468 [Athelia sp. TMB]|nr:hypothetical protein HWV62_14468 [Athelia sp. TMB]
MSEHLETQVKEFYSSTLLQHPPLSGDMAWMGKPLNDTLLFEMDQVIAALDEVALHLADIKLDLMKERVLIARRGLIMVHETSHWENSRAIVRQLHHDIAHGKWEAGYTRNAIVSVPNRDLHVVLAGDRATLRYDYGYYLDRLATMQPKLLQLVHFDVRIHDMAISEWPAISKEDKLVIVGPSRWEDYVLFHEWDSLCCICPSQEPKGAATHKACHVMAAKSGPYQGKWVAQCADQRCGYCDDLRQNPDSLLIREYDVRDAPKGTTLADWGLKNANRSCHGLVGRRASAVEKSLAKGVES